MTKTVSAQNVSAKNVIAIVGQNANRILECQSRRFLDLLSHRGLHGHVLDVAAPDFLHRLDRLLDDGILFAWAYAGVGSRLALGGQNLWAAMKIPFISVLADPPFMMPMNHHVRSSHVVNAYIYRDWLSIQQALFRSPQICTHLGLGVIPGTGRHVRWAGRRHRMVFVKTGADPGRQRSQWQAWPPQLRAVLHDCADHLARAGTQPVFPVVQAALAARSLVLDGARPLLFALLHELDTYIRTLRANTIAKALLPLPADIVGDGWDHLHGSDGQARFLGPIDADALEPLYEQSQTLVNASPNFAGGAHERVLRGFAARCRIASDNNHHARTELAGLRTYHGFEWHEPGLTARLAALLDGPPADEADLDEAQAYVARNHSPEAFITRLIELAGMVRLQETMACYALDAA